MTSSRISSVPVSRRALLSVAAAVAPAAFFGLRPMVSLAQDAVAETPEAPAAAVPQPFSYDILTEQMKALATQPFAVQAAPEGFLGELDYDDYRLINFRDKAMRWKEAGTPFRLGAFHMGWLFPEPVRLYEVKGEAATEMLFSTDDFEYRNELAERVPEHAELPGVAGFRLNHPLNRPDFLDELGSFVGASYFRFLGRGSAYGLSARGLAVNTATSQGEEFPRFSNFYLEPDAGGGDVVTVYATLEGPSVTGAYRMVVRPGSETTVDVTARLFFRQDVEQLGVAPLTSMFFYSEKNRTDFDDFRPNVHDSDGLLIERRGGDRIWRPLNNPKILSGSYFGEENPLRFGLHQRDRKFESYQDTGAFYEKRPSLDIEPLGDWGKGVVRLVEIPTDLEANDNIVAYWIPEQPAKAGDAREYSYRMHWGDRALDAKEKLAHVDETRAGLGGVAGLPPEVGQRKFVIDFKGGMLGQMPQDVTLPPLKRFPPAKDQGPDSMIQPIVTVANGEIAGMTLDKLAGTDIWRLAVDVSAADNAVVELSAHVAGYGQKLTEVWLYQWVNVK
jgi:periplasmic glucans biosynthesis protein